VQTNLRQMRADCDRVLARLEEVEATDAANRASNSAAALRGLALAAAAAAAVAATVLLLGAGGARALCGPGGGGGYLEEPPAACELPTVSALSAHGARVAPVFGPALAAAAALALLLAAAARIAWRRRPVLTKRDQRRVEEFREGTRALARANEALYEAYFSTISLKDER
jgi:hypothetical protein